MFTFFARQKLNTSNAREHESFCVEIMSSFHNQVSKLKRNIWNEFGAIVVSMAPNCSYGLLCTIDIEKIVPTLSLYDPSQYKYI